MNTPDANLRGIIAMLAAMTCFAVSDTALKLLAGQFPPGQILAVRGLMSVGLMAAVVLARGQGRKARLLFHPLVLLRSSTEVVITLLFLHAIARLPLADMTAILQATPIIMTVLAAALGLERVGWRRWSAVALGFCGVLLVARPGTGGFDPYMLAALACAALVAVRDLLVRGVAAVVPAALITLTTTVVLSATGFILGLWETWVPVPPQALIVFAASAVAMSLGSLGLIFAYHGTEIGVVSPFRYAVLVAAIIAGYVVFGDWPDRVAWVGIGLIAAAGIYTMRREAIGRRLRAAAADGDSMRGQA